MNVFDIAETEHIRYFRKYVQNYGFRNVNKFFRYVFEVQKTAIGHAVRAWHLYTADVQRYDKRI